MIASLMMYARPELEGAHARLWRFLRTRLAAVGIDTPEELSNDRSPMEVWRDPALVFSQTCGMPYRRFLLDRVAIIGTPDYGIEGCPPGYYRSAIVVRADDPRARLSDYGSAPFAYNETGSQSGYAAPYATARQAGFWFSDRRVSGGHRHSARMVAEGAADIAAIDALTWRLIERYDPFAAGLRVLLMTDPTPGLPYITALTERVEDMHDATSAAIADLSEEDRDALCLRGLVRIAPETYRAVPTPPPEVLG